jgi:DNA-directed RNA polymerase specialized sigma24 family protein
MDDEPAISGVDPEELIPKAKGDKEAHDQLLSCPWLTKVLNNVSAKMSWEYNVDSEDIWDFVFDRVWLDISSLDNPNNQTWCECLAGWCKEIAKNRALNLIRHGSVEERNRARVEHEHTINIRGRQRNAALYSTSISQEEEVDEKKRVALLLKMRRKAREVFRSLPPEEADLISRWSRGQKLREISAATGIALSTASNRQKEILKVFFAEIEKLVVQEICRTKAEEERVRALLANAKEYQKAFRELIGRSLR